MLEERLRLLKRRLTVEKYYNIIIILFHGTSYLIIGNYVLPVYAH